MPDYAIISVGENNYGHPTEETLSRLRDADVKVYRDTVPYVGFIPTTPQNDAG